ncbi:unnamed protein product [Rotaria socialis]
MLDEANNFHPNIKLVRQIGRSVPFLDVLIENRKGTLTTSVYHKEAAEPYVVPFGSDHPGHVFRNTVDTAITRAVRYSTTLSEFEEEIRQMKLMFLYNGYSPRHIHWRLTTLFSKYFSKYFILPMLHNPDDFDYLRHQLLTTSTDKIYNRTAKSSTTDQTSDKNMQNQLVQPTDNNEITKIKSLIIHKRHEQRLAQNQHHIHELWIRTFHGTDVTNTALIVGASLNRNLKQELMPKMIKSNRRAGINHETTTQHETVELIHYDYHIQALKLEYFQHKPNEYQKQLMIQICQSQYEQEYELLKQKIAYYNLPSQSFECSTISHHPLIDSIQNLTVQEGLKKQFKEVAIQSRIALFNMYLKSAEDQREEYKKKHEANVKKMDASQHTLNKNEKLSSTFVQLINERCNNISERIRCIYKFKSESILLKP